MNITGITEVGITECPASDPMKWSSGSSPTDESSLDAWKQMCMQWWLIYIFTYNNYMDKNDMFCVLICGYCCAKGNISWYKIPKKKNAYVPKGVRTKKFI